MNKLFALGIFLSGILFFLYGCTHTNDAADPTAWRVLDVEVKYETTEVSRLPEGIQRLDVFWDPTEMHEAKFMGMTFFDVESLFAAVKAKKPSNLFYTFDKRDIELENEFFKQLLTFCYIHGINLYSAVGMSDISFPQKYTCYKFIYD